jgi:hypothetical protein
MQNFIEYLKKNLLSNTKQIGIEVYFTQITKIQKLTYPNISVSTCHSSQVPPLTLSPLTPYLPSYHLYLSKASTHAFFFFVLSLNHSAGFFIGFSAAGRLETAVA